MISINHLHPMLVHFPIALVTFGFIAEVAFLKFNEKKWLSKTGFYLLIFGTLSAIAALFTGILFTSELSGTAGQIKETHEMFAWITLFTLIITSVLRIFLNTRSGNNKKLISLAFILYGIAAISVSITGFYGGTLVYNYMMPL